MEIVHQCGKTGLQVHMIRGLGPERDSAEQEVLATRQPLPISHRAVWAAHLDRPNPRFLVLRDANGRTRAGFAIEEVRTRSLPGHVVLRVMRFGGALTEEVRDTALEALTFFARNEPRVLRLQLNLFLRDGHQAISEKLEQLGFREVRPASSYRNTLTIDLKPSEEEIFAALGKSARKRIREVMKMNLRSVVITEPAYAERIKQLQEEALQRTGGHVFQEDWQKVLNLSREHPELSRVFGLFLGAEDTPENMGAFGWVCNHGDHGEYRAAGSKSRGDVRIPFGYLLVWEMIRWSKATGAEWFDMGGVTVEGENRAELEGISAFKRYFTHDVVEVGAEWVLEPAPLRARISDVISVGARRIRAAFRNRVVVADRRGQGPEMALTSRSPA